MIAVNGDCQICWFTINGREVPETSSKLSIYYVYQLYGTAVDDTGSDWEGYCFQFYFKTNFTQASLCTISKHSTEILNLNFYDTRGRCTNILLLYIVYSFFYPVSKLSWLFTNCESYNNEKSARACPKEGFISVLAFINTRCLKTVGREVT